MGTICESANKPPPENLEKPNMEKGETIPNDNNKLVKNINDQIKKNPKENGPLVKTNDDNNKQHPQLRTYNPDLLKSIENSGMNKSVDSCQGVEIITKGGKVNPDFFNNNQSQYINNSGIDTNTQKPLSELSKTISYFENNKNGTVIYFDPKSKTGVNSVKPIFPKMIPQNGKKNITNISNGSYVNVSIHDSGSVQGNCIYIPRKDDQPIPDLERIT